LPLEINLESYLLLC